MPDRRKHRGAHPEDRRLFAEAHHQTLRTAVQEYSWLLTRGYAQDSALKLVGDRHGLTARQRLAVMRSSCSDESLARRQRSEVLLEGISSSASEDHAEASTSASEPLGSDSAETTGFTLALDGYNVLITVESALSGGLILIGRDGCYRDLASVHGTYRKVEETRPAIGIIVDSLLDADIQHLTWYLDRPVSNSGRLRALILDVLQERSAEWEVELVDSPDRALAAFDGLVASSDSWVLDQCGAWVNLAARVINANAPDAWKVDLR
ncbi:MAG: DUF434 domain-containing protein [Phycisphaerales bacterium]|nr:MAG: DUF434 domain-containing protein [Phycisphaerales bacterium]